MVLKPEGKRGVNIGVLRFHPGRHRVRYKPSL